MNGRIAFVSVALTVAANPGVMPSALRAETVDPTPYKWTKEFAGQALDLTGYKLSFSDDFNQPSVTVENGKGPWFAPVKPPYGAATFDRPGPDNATYTIGNGVLTIRASRDADGKWHGGSVQTITDAGKGFAQQYGYFEARMKFPNMPGAWPAFWLKSRQEQIDMAMIRPEIDVIEWYGGNPEGHHRSVHLRPSRDPKFHTPDRLAKHWLLSNYSRHTMVDAWHTYGALLTPSYVTIYLDRMEVARFPALDEFKLHFYPIVSLTLYEKDMAMAVSPFALEVDYVYVYQSVQPNPPSDFKPQ